MTIEDIFEFLRRERHRQGFTSTEIARKARHNATTLRKRENGTYGATIKSLLEWAEALDCEIIVRRKIYK